MENAHFLGTDAGKHLNIHMYYYVEAYKSAETTKLIDLIVKTIDQAIIYTIVILRIILKKARVIRF